MIQQTHVVRDKRIVIHCPGKHIVIEKPIEITLERMDQLLAGVAASLVAAATPAGGARNGGGGARRRAARRLSGDRPAQVGNDTTDGGDTR